MAQVGGGARAGGPDAVVSWSTLLKRHPRSNVAQHTLLSVSAVILIVFYDETISPRLVSLNRVLARRYLFYGRGLPLRGTRHRVRWPESHQTARPRLVCFWLEFRIEQTEESFFLFCGRPCRCWLVTNGERWHTNPSASREWWIKAIVCFLILFHHQGCWLLNSHWDAKQIALRHRFISKFFCGTYFYQTVVCEKIFPKSHFRRVCCRLRSYFHPPNRHLRRKPLCCRAGPVSASHPPSLHNFSAARGIVPFPSKNSSSHLTSVHIPTANSFFFFLVSRCFSTYKLIHP